MQTPALSSSWRRMEARKAGQPSEDMSISFERSYGSSCRVRICCLQEKVSQHIVTLCLKRNSSPQIVSISTVSGWEPFLHPVFFTLPQRPRLVLSRARPSSGCDRHVSVAARSCRRHAPHEASGKRQRTMKWTRIWGVLQSMKHMSPSLLMGIYTVYHGIPYPRLLDTYSGSQTRATSALRRCLM